MKKAPSIEGVEELRPIVRKRSQKYEGTFLSYIFGGIHPIHFMCSGEKVEPPKSTDKTKKKFPFYRKKSYPGIILAIILGELKSPTSDFETPQSVASTSRRESTFTEETTPSTFNPKEDENKRF